MYSTKTRTFSPSSHSLAGLPLGRFYEDYLDIRNEVVSSYSSRYQNLLEAAKTDFVSNWNKTNESSYEGSFEELNLEGQVRAKLGKMPDVGSDPRVVELVENFARDFAVPKNAGWIFGQALAKFAQLKLEKNDRGYSARALFGEISKSPELSALLVLFRYSKRSSLVLQQTAAEQRNFCALVPLVMSAFKQFNNVKYAEWDREEIFGITEMNLVNAMLLEALPELTKEDMLEARQAALMIKTGEKAGTYRNPATTYSLYFTTGSGMTSIPTLARIMMAQCWCAHPNNRTELMILNPLKWDDMPEELIVDQPFEKTATQKNTASSLPWWI